MKSKTALLLFPHQLFYDDQILPECEEIFLVEEYLFFKQYSFHKQKIAYHRATMKTYADFLSALNRKWSYIESLQAESDVRLLIPHLVRKGYTRLMVFNPCDDWLKRRFMQFESQIELEWHDSPSWLLLKEELNEHFSAKRKRYLQADFYQKMRVKLKILVDDDQLPIGGKWSFDADNRKKLPENHPVPKEVNLKTSEKWEEACQYTHEHFNQNYGSLGEAPLYPISRREALEWLDEFLRHRLAEFGDYEDAIEPRHFRLFHSVLSPLLNNGMITPKEVLVQVINQAEKYKIPMNSLEGFVRQVIGWREFIRGVYHFHGRTSRTQNFWGFERDMPSAFYTGNTGIPPVDDAIRKVLKTGYCHHIERLMVLGNFMLLCEIHPKAVYQWFMELFIDAYDWVMVPNVYGMSQFADGGLFATKPYIGGSNYIRKMSSYAAGEWCEVWDGLFWRFVHVNRFFFEKNPRAAMMLRNWERMKTSKREQHLRNAEDFLRTLHRE